MQVVNAGAPSLRARNREKHIVWGDMLVPLVVDRLRGADKRPRAQALVAASLVAFDVAIAAWADPEESREPEVLLAIAFEQLRHL